MKCTAWIQLPSVRSCGGRSDACKGFKAWILFLIHVEVVMMTTVRIRGLSGRIKPAGFEVLSAALIEMQVFGHGTVWIGM